MIFTLSNLKIRLRGYLIHTYIVIICLFGRIVSRIDGCLRRKISLAGFGLLVKTLTIPLGNDTIRSPDILTWHFDSSLPLKDF